jgi:hypothetical protein
MIDNSEPGRHAAVETDYSAQEAEQMGAFVEDALSFEDALERARCWPHDDARSHRTAA